LLYFPVVLRPTLDAAHATMAFILEMGDVPVVSLRGIFSADQWRCLWGTSVSLWCRPIRAVGTPRTV